MGTVIFFLFLFAVALSMMAGVSWLAYWVLTGEGGIEVNARLFGVLAAVFWSLITPSRTKSSK